MHLRAKMRAGRGSDLFDVFNIVFMLVFSFLVLYPFWNQLVYSINEGNDAARGGLYFWPRKISFDAYGYLFHNPRLVNGALISLLRVGVGTVTCLFCTGLLAYVVSIRNFSGRRFLRILFMLTMYISGGLIPYYLLISRLGMTNTFSVYWVPGLLNAYYMMLMASYIQELPESMMEAARIDGCTELKTYWKIIVPMSIPVYAAIAVYLSVEHWNSWFDCMIYNPGGKWDTLQVFLRRMLLEREAAAQATDQMVRNTRFRNITPVTIRAATTMLVTLPIACSYPFFQKYFVGGLTLGAVKG